jgi:divalent metal cation (Fe/Co/Zn/Cd) transporter
MTLLTHNGYFDVSGMVMIGLLLVLVAIVLAIETKSLLLGEAASLDSVHRIEAALGTSPGVERIIHMKTLHLGPEEVLVAAKIAVRSSVNAAEVAGDDQHRRGEHPNRRADGHRALLEPDIYDPNHMAAARPERPAAPSH